MGKKPIEKPIEKFDLVRNKPGSSEWEQVALKRDDIVFYDRLQRSMGIERAGRRIKIASVNSPYSYGSIDEIDSPAFMRILFLISALAGLEFQEKEKNPGDPVVEFMVL